MKRKVIVVISARASYSRIKTALTAMSKNETINLSIVLMASAASAMYGDIKTQIISDGIKISAILETLSDYDNHYGQVLTTANCLVALASVLQKEKPDVVITIADRYETISTAIAASYMNIPLIHLQGGEVTGNIDERVRHAITKLADIHFVCTDKSLERVIRMGESPDCVYNVGCPSCDIAREALFDERTSIQILNGLGITTRFSLFPKSYVVVVQHSVTDEYDRMEQQFEATYGAVCRLNVPVLWFGNNSDAGSKYMRSLLDAHAYRNDAIEFINNVPGREFLVILRDCRCLIGNSSVGVRECSYMGVPVVNIGSRQDGRERGANVVDTDFNVDHIIGAYKTIITREIKKVSLYGDGHAGIKIAELVATMNLNTKKG